MRTAFRLTTTLAAVATAGLLAAGAPHAEAQDFFANFFDTLSGRPPPPQRALNYGAPEMSIFPPEQTAPPPPPPRASGGRGTAYCVRTCDGRYFPLAASGGQSRAEMCKSFCPAAETRVVYGSSIDHAATEGGKPYSELPNAFRYREELVAGCTCNGKDPGGLARVDVDSDPTIRKGDLVASPHGLVVANTGGSGRHGAVNYSPASKSVRARFERLPVVAAE